MPNQMPQRIGRKTGPKPRFTVDDVVDAALELGVDTFTLGQVAAELGITTSALYRVIDGRDALVDLCLQRWIGQVAVTSTSTSPTWQERMREFADSIWEVNSRYPGMATAHLQRPHALMRHLEEPMAELCRSLLDAGFEGGAERVAFAVDFVADTVQASFLGAQVFSGQELSGARGIVQERAEEEAAAPETRAATAPGSTGPGSLPSGRGAMTPPAVSEGSITVQDYLDTVEVSADGESPADDDKEWTYKTWLDRKIDFIIAGLEQGL
ncbi:TetR/AcrR family transcriptional regulator [Brachybacterium sp. AOP35-5H-19]|uniref:TetR/AcrR family transcriptional regulator n=1 Tax=Brachybacterium sp. AOP35-5H-19 TaxID=3457685 RepID=UPI003FB9A1FF